MRKKTIDVSEAETILKQLLIKIDGKVRTESHFPFGGKQETLKFEGEYDFDKAKEEFKEVLENLLVSKKFNLVLYF